MPTLVAMLRLLATSDLHAHAFGWDYHSDKPQAGLGLSDLAHMIDVARAECPNTLLLDNGDFLQGSPLGDWAAEQDEDTPHPMISAMNALGYDAATLGNHEFSHGLPLLRRAMADAHFPFVSANLQSLDDGPFAQRSILIDRDLTDDHGKSLPIRIGITGIAPPQTVIWEAGRIDGQIAASDAVPAATEAVTALRRAGADVVILLAHTGMGSARSGQDKENVALPLARLSGADVMIMGHTHLVYPDPAAEAQCQTGTQIHGKPAVMPGFFGSHLGRIDMTLRHDGIGWSLSDSRADLLPARAVSEPHLGLESVCGAAHQAARTWLGTRIGKTDSPLHSYFSRISPCKIMQLVAAAQCHHVRTSLACTAFADLPVLSATAPFRAGGRGGAMNFTDIAQGPLELRHAVNIYPFPNSIVALLLTGEELGDWLERAAIQFATIDPAQPDRPLINTDSPSFDFDLIAGLSFQFDLTQPPRFDAHGRCINPTARRIRNLALGGRKITTADRFILATNSYRAAGSGSFPGCRPDRILLNDRTSTRSALISYLRPDQGDMAPAPYDWSFAPVGGTATFDTAETAACHLHHISALRPEPMAGAAPGYQRFRLHL